MASLRNPTATLCDQDTWNSGKRGTRQRKARTYWRYINICRPPKTNWKPWHWVSSEERLVKCPSSTVYRCSSSQQPMLGKMTFLFHEFGIPYASQTETGGILSFHHTSGPGKTISHRMKMFELLQRLGGLKSIESTVVCWVLKNTRVVSYWNESLGWWINIFEMHPYRGGKGRGRALKISVQRIGICISFPLSTGFSRC